jgi:hypothetical protein
MMNAGELTQRRRLCVLARAQQCTPSAARVPLSYEYRDELLATEYPCLPADISAPLIDFNSLDISYNGPIVSGIDVSYSFSWGCVPGATHYKVFIRGPSSNDYINVGVPPTYENFVTVAVSAPPMFDDTSPLLTSTSYSGNSVLTDGTSKLNFFVFAYRNGKRSDIPCTQLCIYYNDNTPNPDTIDTSLWPVITQEFTGGPGFMPTVFDFNTVTVRNRYSKVSRTLTSAYTGFGNTLSGVPSYPENVVGATALASVIYN